MTGHDDRSSHASKALKRLTPLLLLVVIGLAPSLSGASPAPEEGARENSGSQPIKTQVYDPTGYLYDEATGEILSGGLIDVSGPGAINLIQDGSGGFYQFTTDGTPGIYSVTLTPPIGYAPSTLCLAQDPPAFDPTGGPNPTILGNDEDGATGFLTSNACTPYYLSFDLAAGDPDVFFNNFPLHSTPLCFAIADSDKVTSSDELTVVDPATGTSLAIGSLGTLDVEAAAFSPEGATLYAANGGQLGTVDLATGLYTALPNPVGAAAGAAGNVLLDDIDSLSFDPYSGILYGVHRTTGADTPDLLFQIDPVSGALVPDAFGAGVDYVEIPLLLGLESIDDIAVDPADGQMYAILNDDPSGFSDRLVQIDKTTGAIADVGPLGVSDVEGLSFSADGNLYASSGADGTFSTRDRLFQVDKATGAATAIAPLLALATDYESLACEPGINTITGTVFYDSDVDGVFDDPPEGGQTGVTVELYLDNNNDGLLDAGDTLIQTTVSDADGDYTFEIPLEGNFVIAVDLATLPADAVLTTDNVEEADFVGFGNTDAGNDFGLVLLDFGDAPDPPYATLSASDGARHVLGSGLTLGTAVDAEADGQGEATANGDDTADGNDDEDGIVFPALPLGAGDGAAPVAVTAAAAGLLNAWIDFNQDGDWDDPGEQILADVAVTAGVNNLTFAVPLMALEGATFARFRLSSAGGLGPEGLALDGEVEDYQIPVVATATLGDRIWDDLDVDGIQDAGEPGIPGVTVELIDSGGNVIDTTTTDANGNYSFTDLAPGDYAIRVTPPAGYSFSPQDQGGDDAIDSDTDPATGETANVTLAPGDDVDTLDSGLYQPASLGDLVWDDLDADGVQDPGEPGIPGVTVELLDSGGNVIDTTTTDASGNYAFTDLVPGDYAIDVTPPAGYTFSPQDQGGDDALDSDTDPATGETANVTLAPGQNFDDLDSGLYQPATLTGQVWDDFDKDGVQDPGEPGIPGATVELLDDGGNVIATTTTDANGDYSFTDLPPGDYAIEVTPPAGYDFSPQDQGGDDTVDSDTDPATGQTATVTLNPGETVGNVDSGLYRPASLGDLVWDDLDADGVQDPGEPGIPGVTVELLDSGSNVIDTTTTDASGNYAFTDLGAGDYAIDVTPPAGYTFSPQDQGGDDALDSDTDPATGETANITLAPGQDFDDLDSGLYQPANLTGQVWDDFDKDGVQDPGEPGIPGATVELLDDGGNVIDTTTTDANGDYSFPDLPPGDYAIEVTPSAGYDFSPQDQGGDDTVDSDTDPATGQTATVTLNPGETVDNVDSGLYRPASLGDFVWDDLDADGVQDPGEPGIPGVTVELLDSGGNVIDTTTTDASGNYAFTDLGAGDYAIDVTPPAGYTFSPQDQGGDDALDSDTDPATGETANITLAPGQDFEDLDSGLYQPAALGDFIWDDLDGDGVQDAGEPGMAGVSVELLDGGGNVVASTTTDADGNYTFTGLTPGDYAIRVTPPGGFVIGPQDQGDDDALDSDIDPATGESATVTLISRQTDNDLDAGLYQPASLGDYVWEDLDGDGLQDPEEVGIEAVQVDLLLADLTPVATTTTAADGSYGFTGLAPGDYIVAFTPPAGFSISPQDQGADDAVDSDPNPTTGQTAGITLISGENDDTIDAGMPPPPTEAAIADFRAHVHRGRVVVEWETTSEAGTAGFLVYRLDEAGKRTVPVYDHLVPGLLHAPAGGVYRLLDENAPDDRSLTYFLQEVEANGRTLVHGPFVVDTEAIGEAPTGRFDRRARPVPAETSRRLAASRTERRAYDREQSGRRGAILKIHVRKSGLYFLATNEIAQSMELSPFTVRQHLREGKLRLTQEGETVAWLEAKAGSGLYFYGERRETLFSDDNVYRLILWTGETMATETVGAAPPVPGRSFRETLEVEEDHEAAIHLAGDPEADHWYWKSLSSGHPTLGRHAFSVRLPDVADAFEDVELRVSLRGSTDLGLACEHHAIVEVNGEEVGDTCFTGTRAHQATFSFPQRLLRSGENEITVSGVLDPGIYFSLFYVDGFEVSYQRHYRAEGSELEFAGEDLSALTVEGFAEQEVQLFDITSAKRPIQLLGYEVGNGAGGYRLSFEPERSGRRYLAVSSSALLSPAAIEADALSDLRGNANRADVVIVAASQLVEAAEDLARYHRERGREAVVADLEDVMDEFRHGIYDPRAIREFLRHAVEHWQRPPRFAVLAGAGHYDYRDLLGHGGNLVPPLLVSTGAGLFASDNRFGDFDGDGVPEIALGRLPVMTADELRGYVSRLEAREASGGAWQRRALLLADNPDAGGLFPSDSLDLATLLPPTLLKQPLDLEQLPLLEARQILLRALDSGTGWVSYLGHGALDRLADEGWLRSADVAGLRNAPRLPILTGMTCAINRFAIPGFQSLGQELVTAESGGAVAVWAPSGLSQHPQAVLLAEAFVQEAFRDGMTLGEAIVQALRSLAEQGGTENILSIYNLLGDPTLIVQP